MDVVVVFFDYFGGEGSVCAELGEEMSNAVNEERSDDELG